MTPMATLLLCFPAALVFVVCVCGVAALWPTAAQPDEYPRGGGQQ